MSLRPLPLSWQCAIGDAEPRETVGLIHLMVILLAACGCQATVRMALLRAYREHAAHTSAPSPKMTRAIHSLASLDTTDTPPRNAIPVPNTDTHPPIVANSANSIAPSRLFNRGRVLPKSRDAAANQNRSPARATMNRGARMDPGRAGMTPNAMPIGTMPQMRHSRAASRCPVA
jgi:hypothetical protein